MQCTVMDSALFSLLAFNIVLGLMVFSESLFRVIVALLKEIEESIGRSSLLEDFKMSELPALHAKCIELIELLVRTKWIS